MPVLLALFELGETRAGGRIWGAVSSVARLQSRVQCMLPHSAASGSSTSYWWRAAQWTTRKRACITCSLRASAGEQSPCGVADADVELAQLAPARCMAPADGTTAAMASLCGQVQAEQSQRLNESLLRFFKGRVALSGVLKMPVNCPELLAWSDLHTRTQTSQRRRL